jgi:hypothetical protein
MNFSVCLVGKIRKISLSYSLKWYVWRSLGYFEAKNRILELAKYQKKYIKAKYYKISSLFF